MTGIRATLKPGYYIIVFGKKINYFSFSFIAPLEPEYYIYHLMDIKYISCYCLY